jgi:hypothetical protein
MTKQVALVTGGMGGLGVSAISSTPNGESFAIAGRA